MSDAKIAEVSAVLLQFSLLTSAQRAAFMESLNTFVYSSPQKQLKLIEVGVEECRESARIDIQRIAEEAATYVAARMKKRR